MKNINEFSLDQIHQLWESAEAISSSELSERKRGFERLIEFDVVRRSPLITYLLSTQTYDNIEIIIVDDGSTDSSLEIAKTYEKEHTNIKVEVQNNSGAPVARNRAFEISSGDYIQYLDADDILHPDKIRLQMDVLQEEGDDTIVFGRLGVFQKEIKNTVWMDTPVYKNYDDSKQFLLDLWESGRGVFTFLWLTPRKLIEESGGWDESLAKNQDGEFFARVAFKAAKVLFLKNSISYYRTDNENSISRHVSKKSLRANFDSFETYVKLFKNDVNRPEVRKSLALVYSKYLFLVYPEHKDLVQKTEEKLRYFGFQKPIIKQGDKYYYLSKLIGVYSVMRIRKLLGK